MNARINVSEVEEARALYDTIRRTSNRFLNDCKYLPMEFLQGEVPSFTELATIMRRVAQIIHILADDFDPHMVMKANHNCELMTGIGVGIDENDHIQLQQLVGELERGSGL